MNKPKMNSKQLTQQPSLKQKLDQATAEVRMNVSKRNEEVAMEVAKKTGRVVAVVGIVLGGLYFSKYLFKALSETIAAGKELKRTIQA